MWNETKTAASVVDRAVGRQTGVWQESPLVGVDALLKSIRQRQARHSD